ncbi:GDSL esterase/lipase At1g71250-like isoform X2 [Miscanthus floridulus]|uniref:GDSL esterase/lipase At1g71250-like isoform X2 n=1 Tax=Miscanthus floridulus TaxID=154761 RepID=UPI003459537F
MKLVHRNLVRNGPGSVKLVPGEEDDLWHAYNLIAIGDNLQAVTVRKVLREVASGGRDAERVKLKLEIVVESVDYDKEGSVLRVRGKNITENDHVKEIWDWLALETIQQACDPAASADLAVILMQEGLAHLFLIGRRCVELLRHIYQVNEVVCLAILSGNSLQCWQTNLLFPIWSASGLLLCIAFLAELVQGGAIPAALYMLGDSQADVGNNNYLVTPARADFPHNGVDYPGHVATGRFSNGYNFVDFLAASLGVVSPPAYRSIFNATGSSSSSMFLKGVNFASGGAGVLALTNMGLCISFDEQIERDYYSVYAALSRQLGKAQASIHLAESVFAIAIGGNDIIDRVLLDPAGPLNSTQFIDLMAQSLKRQLQRMYGLGMRRLFFVGAAALGCIPLLRERERSLDNSQGCYAEANSLSVEYNTAVASLLRGLSARHSDFQYSFFNTSTALLLYIQELEANGAAEVKAACCGLGSDNAMFGCTPVSSLCPNRSNHVFWDFVHPTELTAQKLTRVAFDGSAPLVSPVNLRQLCAT